MVDQSSDLDGLISKAIDDERVLDGRLLTLAWRS
jgi:hypothetical protein